MIRYGCGKCRMELESPPQLAGKTDRCPNCGAVNKVPVLSSPGATLPEIAGWLWLPAVLVTLAPFFALADAGNMRAAPPSNMFLFWLDIFRVIVLVLVAVLFFQRWFFVPKMMVIVCCIDIVFTIFNSTFLILIPRDLILIAYFLRSKRVKTTFIRGNIPVKGFVASTKNPVARAERPFGLTADEERAAHHSEPPPGPEKKVLTARNVIYEETLAEPVKPTIEHPAPESEARPQASPAPADLPSYVREKLSGLLDKHNDNIEAAMKEAMTGHDASREPRVRAAMEQVAGEREAAKPPSAPGRLATGNGVPLSENQPHAPQSPASPREGYFRGMNGATDGKSAEPPSTISIIDLLSANSPETKKVSLYTRVWGRSKRIAKTISSPLRSKWKILAIIVVFVLFIFFVWPTPYDYHSEKDVKGLKDGNELLRINRLTQNVAVLRHGEWISIREAEVIDKHSEQPLPTKPWYGHRGGYTD